MISRSNCSPVHRRGNTKKINSHNYTSLTKPLHIELYQNTFKLLSKHRFRFALKCLFLSKKHNATETSFKISAKGKGICGLMCLSFSKYQNIQGSSSI